MMVAQSAFWVGLLYDDAALAAAEALLRGVGVGMRWRFARRCRDKALRRRSVAERCATWRVRWWRSRGMGCGRAAVAIPTGADEATYLAPLEAIAAGGPTQAEYWLARYRGDWHGDASRIFAEAAI